MTAKSFWWQTGVAGDGSSQYTEVDHSRWVKVVGACGGNEGIGPGYGSEFDATANPGSGTDRTVRIGTGGAIVDGKPLDQDITEDHVLDSTPSYRRDRLVLKADWSARTVRIAVLKGTDGSETPPAIPSDNPGTLVYHGLWQVRLVSSGAVTLEVDEREWALIQIDSAVLEIIDGVLGVKTGGITSDKIGTGEVATIDLADDAVDGDKLADNSVSTLQLVNNAVFDTKIGERVLGLDRRQGGDISDWTTPGPTNRTPANLRMRVGAIQWTGSAVGNGTKTVTFPLAFSAAPIVLVQSLDNEVVAVPLSSQTTQFTINWKAISVTKTSITFFWVAIGAE